MILTIVDDDTLEVKEVAVTSEEADGYYDVGDTIEITVNFNGNLTVTTTGGTPRFAFDLGGNTRYANHTGYEMIDIIDEMTMMVTSTETNEKGLVFSYEVVAGDVDDPDDISWAANALELNGGTIKFKHTDMNEQVDANLDLDAQAALPAHKVDVKKPEVVAASAQDTTVTVTFSEELNTAAPSIGAFSGKKTPDGASETDLSFTGAPSISGKVLTLTLASTSEIAGGDTDVKLSYDKTMSTTNRIKDLSGQEADSFTDRAVETDPPPVFQNTPYNFTVDENATSGAVGTVTAEDPEMQTVTYSVGGTDATAFNGDFELNSMTGVITVKSTATIDFETISFYSVTVTATDSAMVPATAGVTISVTNLDEAGTVTLSESTPSLGRQVTATLDDPDGSVSGESWIWGRGASRTGSFSTIPGETAATYTPAQADLNMYLFAMVTYTDALGPNKNAQAASDNATASSRPPVFGQSSYTFTVNENATSGAVGTVSATDPDSSDTVTYSVRGTDAAAFNGDFSLNSTSGAITVRSAATIDYESRPSYRVTIRASDQHNSFNDADVTVNVNNLDEAGAVSLSAATPSQGAPLTATLADEDGSVSGESWSWSSATTRTGTFSAISGAGNSPSYTPVAGDVGRFLKARVTYTDAQGVGQERREGVGQRRRLGPAAGLRADLVQLHGQRERDLRDGGHGEGKRPREPDRHLLGGRHGRDGLQR